MKKEYFLGWAVESEKISESIKYAQIVNYIKEVSGCNLSGDAFVYYGLNKKGKAEGSDNKLIGLKIYTVDELHGILFNPIGLVSTQKPLI